MLQLKTFCFHFDFLKVCYAMMVINCDQPCQCLVVFWDSFQIRLVIGHELLWSSRCSALNVIAIVMETGGTFGPFLTNIGSIIFCRHLTGDAVLLENAKVHYPC